MWMLDIKSISNKTEKVNRKNWQIRNRTLICQLKPGNDLSCGMNDVV